ncbi:hypothetical protein CKF54_05775 [Psittacicella hinzii]|uniref:YobI-like P-loop NTPase domain-containing protein n=1 Tax=Psittacicella hinzii TaxID=2028575 RepID=A0A3A1Y3Z9_9GAMM|nr:hypothetical protein [Psittacicella hinzii]RIY31948.1 hypothetical protein CKF54_05775 [Psittacicella hinzii]
MFGTSIAMYLLLFLGLQFLFDPVNQIYAFIAIFLFLVNSSLFVYSLWYTKNNKSIKYSVAYIAILLAIFLATYWDIFLALSVVSNISFAFYSPEVITNIAIIVKVVSLVIGAFFCVSRLLYLKFELSELKLNIQSNEASFKSGDELSDDTVLDRDIREIIYLLRSAKVRALAFEDLDRFNDISIFEKLRGINNLINQIVSVNDNEEDRKTVKFIYFLKDDLFTSAEDRAKFFDLIIPIYPIIDLNLSFIYFKQCLNDSDIEDSFLRKCSLYLNDPRVIANIANEYKLTLDIFESRDKNTFVDGGFAQVHEEERGKYLDNPSRYRNFGNVEDSLLNINAKRYKRKILGTVIIKNLFATEFYQATRGEGFFYEIFNQLEELSENLFKDLSECEYLLKIELFWKLNSYVKKLYLLHKDYGLLYGTDKSESTIIENIHKLEEVDLHWDKIDGYENYFTMKEVSKDEVVDLEFLKNWIEDPSKTYKIKLFDGNVYKVDLGGFLSFKSKLIKLCESFGEAKDFVEAKITEYEKVLSDINNIYKYRDIDRNCPDPLNYIRVLYCRNFQSIQYSDLLNDKLSKYDFSVLKSTDTSATINRKYKAFHMILKEQSFDPDFWFYFGRGSTNSSEKILGKRDMAFLKILKEDQLPRLNLLLENPDLVYSYLTVGQDFSQIGILNNQLIKFMIKRGAEHSDLFIQGINGALALKARFTDNSEFYHKINNMVKYFLKLSLTDNEWLTILTSVCKNEMHYLMYALLEVFEDYISDDIEVHSVIRVESQNYRKIFDLFTIAYFSTSELHLYNITSISFNDYKKVIPYILFYENLVSTEVLEHIINKMEDSEFNHFVNKVHRVSSRSFIYKMGRELGKETFRDFDLENLSEVKCENEKAKERINIVKEMLKKFPGEVNKWNKK